MTDSINEKEDSIFIGILLSSLGEKGPELHVNKTPLSEGEALQLAAQNLIAVGFGFGAPKGVHGPLPVPGLSDLRSIALTFKIKSSIWLPPKKRVYRKQCVFVLPFPVSKTSLVLQAMESIGSYFSELMEKKNMWTSEEDFTEKNVEALYDELNNVFSESKLKLVFPEWFYAEKETGHLKAVGISGGIFPHKFVVSLFKELIEALGLEKAGSIFHRLQKEITINYVENLKKFGVTSASTYAETVNALKRISTTFTTLGYGNVEFNIENKAKAIFRTNNSFVAEEFKGYGHKVCYFFSGTFEGAFKAMFGEEYDCTETKCMAKGDEYCEFEIVKRKKKRGRRRKGRR